MILKVRINNDDTKMYRLTDWNAASFANGYVLTVQSDNLSKVSNDFSEIQKIEIFQDDLLVATYTDLDSYSEIAFVKNIYVPGEQKFVDALRVGLVKTDLIEQVQRLDNQINPTIDIDSMTLPELKEYCVKRIGKICREEIYAGEEVTLPDGTVQNFSYSADDQANLGNAITLAFAARQLGFDLDYIPYHANSTMCALYDTESIVAIYMTLQLRLTRLTTKCNMLNCMIRGADSKEDVLAITWDTQLTEEYQQRYNEIITIAIETAQAMAEAMRPETPDDGEDDEE